MGLSKAARQGSRRVVGVVRERARNIGARPLPVVGQLL
jgi:hypothetical protein